MEKKYRISFKHTRSDLIVQQIRTDESHPFVRIQNCLRDEVDYVSIVDKIFTLIPIAVLRECYISVEEIAE